MAAVAAQQEDIEELQPKTVKTLTLLSLKRTYDLFAANHAQKVPLDEESQRTKIACKVLDEYESVKDRAVPVPAQPRVDRNDQLLQAATLAEDAVEKEARSVTAKLIDTMPASRPQGNANALVIAQQVPKMALVPTADGGTKKYVPSAQLSRRIASKWPRPAWHPPWKCYRVMSGHLGWVRSIAFDPSNEWFVTGAADRTIKFWDTASGQLKLTLTGHIEQVTGLGVSARHPYMFSCALDKQVKCWDLETNRVIRQYHGHLSGVYSLALHPTLDVLMTGGRDSVCRVWDMRTKVQIHCLSGHHDNVCSILSQGTDPQVITGSHDHTIRLWDLRKGSTISTLTYHKKSVRAMAMHPSEHAFASASAENIKKFRLPEGEFLHNMLQQQRAIVNSMAINEDGVMMTGGDNGSLWAWDWRSGNCFQQQDTIAQPGSLESEAGIFAMSFDVTGTRLVTCEADKTVKMWKEDTSATEESHPIVFKPPKDIKRF